jgi:hypothetical protein
MPSQVHLIPIPTEIKSNDDHQIAQQQYTPLEVIALPLSVHVRQQEHAQDDGHHVPLREE